MASGLRTGPAVAAELARSSAVVRVRNLQLTITGPRDGWGRSGKPQPLLCSVEVYMKRSFAASSSQDAVASDTVHYGLLSKAIPGFVEAVPSSRHSLQGMVYYVYSQLTGLCPGPNGMQQVSSGESFLDMSNVMGVKLTALLPKGSLMGAGVSEAAVALIKDGGTEQAGDPGPIYSTSLCIHRLQVPTLVGVNDNERTAKQIVVANISFEPLSSVEELDYVKLEAVVVEVSFNMYGVHG